VTSQSPPPIVLLAKYPASAMLSDLVTTFGSILVAGCPCVLEIELEANCRGQRGPFWILVGRQRLPTPRGRARFGGEPFYPRDRGTSNGWSRWDRGKAAEMDRLKRLRAGKTEPRHRAVG
jgi:hypothetical protein